jgi:hypothetical protein
VEALKLGLDGHLQELEGGRRTLPDPSVVGAHLLALGLREPVRDVLRGPIDSAELVVLFARYAEWAGADEFVTKHWPRALAEARHLDRRAWLPIAEAIGDRVAVAEFVDGGPLDAEPVPDPIEPLYAPRPNALDGVVHLAPSLPAGWPEMTLTRLRVGPTTLDIRVRRRPAGLAVKVRVTHGPPLVVRLSPQLERPATGVLVGGEQLAGPEVRITLTDEEEGVWMM